MYFGRLIFSEAFIKQVEDAATAALFMGLMVKGLLKVRGPGFFLSL